MLTSSTPHKYLVIKLLIYGTPGSILLELYLLSDLGSEVSPKILIDGHLLFGLEARCKDDVGIPG